MSAVSPPGRNRRMIRLAPRGPAQAAIGRAIRRAPGEPPEGDHHRQARGKLTGDGREEAQIETAQPARDSLCLNGRRSGATRKGPERSHAPPRFGRSRREYPTPPPGGRRPLTSPKESKTFPDRFSSAFIPVDRRRFFHSRSPEIYFLHNPQQLPPISPHNPLTRPPIIATESKSS